METYKIITEDDGLGKRCWEVKVPAKGKAKLELKLQRTSHGGLKEFVTEDIKAEIYKLVKKDVYVLKGTYLVKSNVKPEQLIKLAEGK